jgi:hypothetical protein
LIANAEFVSEFWLRKITINLQFKRTSQLPCNDFLEVIPTRHAQGRANARPTLDPQMTAYLIKRAKLEGNFCSALGSAMWQFPPRPRLL